MPSDPVRIEHEGQLVETDNPLPVVLAVSENEQTVILYPHHEIHAGSFFSTSHITANGTPLADDANLTMALIVGAKELHFQGFGSCGGDFELRLYEGADVDEDGTLLTVVNHKRNSLQVTTVTARLDPTVNDSGEYLHGFFSAGGSGFFAVGGEGSQRNEFILAPNTTYLLILTNRAGSAQPASLIGEWYEETVE